MAYGDLALPAEAEGWDEVHRAIKAAKAWRSPPVSEAGFGSRRPPDHRNPNSRKWTSGDSRTLPKVQSDGRNLHDRVLARPGTSCAGQYELAEAV